MPRKEATVAVEPSAVLELPTPTLPAVSGGAPVDADEAVRLVAAEKEAGGASPQWAETRLASGLLVRKTLVPLALTVHPPPASGHLLVMGDWRRPDLIQIRLVLTARKVRPTSNVSASIQFIWATSIGTTLSKCLEAANRRCS